MDNYIFEHILRELLKEHIDNYNANVLINKVEEYLEWLKNSKKRFCILEPDYKYYLDPLITILEEYQATLILKEEQEGKDYLIDKITYFEKLKIIE